MMGTEDSIEGPVIIVGSGRCGTTLLVAQLNASGVIYIPYETSFLVRSIPAFLDKKIEPLDYELLANLFIVTSEARGWELEAPSIIKMLHEEEVSSLQDAVRAIYRLFLKDKGIPFPLMWGLKRPLMICHLDRVFKAFPDAKVINLARDGRDVQLSYNTLHSKSSVKFGPQGLITGSIYWAAGLRMAKRYRSRVHTIRYEDLLSSNNAELSRLGDFLNIPDLAEKCSKYQTKAAPSVVTGEAAEFIHKKVYKGVDKNNQNKYVDRMSGPAKLVFELFGASELRDYGYALHFPVLSGLFLPIRALAIRLGVLWNTIRYRSRDAKFLQRAESMCGE